MISVDDFRNASIRVRCLMTGITFCIRLEATFRGVPYCAILSVTEEMIRDMASDPRMMSMVVEHLIEEIVHNNHNMTRHLRANWTIEAQRDYEATHGSEILNPIAQELGLLDMIQSEVVTVVGVNRRWRRSSDFSFEKKPCWKKEGF